MMKTLICNIKHIAFLFHKLMHKLYRSRLIIITAYVHTLHTEFLVIGEKLHLGKISFFLFCYFVYCPLWLQNQADE